MSDFEFELKQAFDSQEAPVDHAFAETVAGHVARRETRRRWFGVAGVGVLGAGGAAALTPTVVQFAERASATPAAIGVEAAGVAETLGVGLVQSFGWLSAVSPAAFFVAAVSGAALAYIAQRP